MIQITKEDFKIYSKSAIHRVFWESQILNMSYTALPDTSVLIALRVHEPSGNGEEMFFISKKDIERFTRIVERTGSWKTTTQTRLHFPPNEKKPDDLYPNAHEERE